MAHAVTDQILALPFESAFQVNGLARPSRTMGRTNKRPESALKAAAEMLETTKNQTVKAQLIRIVIDYELRQQERAISHKTERHKRAENKELAGLRSNVEELTDKLSSAERSKEKEVSEIRAVAEEKITLATCKKDLAIEKQVAEEARAKAAANAKAARSSTRANRTARTQRRFSEQVRFCV
jgi:hypothetical protein